MKTEELISSITESITDRFFVEEENDFSKMLLSLTGNSSLQRSVIRIQRNTEDNSNRLLTWKTLLIVELRAIDELKVALEWTASVKDTLLDPETADLYLFVIFENDNVTLEQSFRIESTEQFCRKYVQRPGKSGSEFVERTFLGKLIATKQDIEPNDPLNNALALTEKNNTWFTRDEQLKWKKHLLSPNTGYELVELLIPENKE